MKQGLREEYSAKRDALGAAERHLFSQAVAQNLEALPVWRAGAKIGFYASFRSEVETLDLLARALKAGKRAALPVTRREKGALEFHWVEDLAALKAGTYGILEPPAGKPADPEELDLILVPGLAFDPEGRRLGYGAGYYDRTLGGSKALKVGLAFDFQVAASLPGQPHDVSMDLVVTEKRVLEIHSPRSRT
jgi:5-formyltetrahydrofolate cyclo-ligase